MRMTCRKEDRPTLPNEIEVTPAMVEAGEEVILAQVGGADLGGAFSARDLAAEVYRAMYDLRAVQSP